jgi:hypothetical protein
LAKVPPYTMFKFSTKLSCGITPTPCYRIVLFFVGWINEINMINLVEIFTDKSEQSCNQKCKFGNLVKGHAVYCHSENPDAPRKCRRTFYTNGEVKDEDCEFYEPNPNFVERGEK